MPERPDLAAVSARLGWALHEAGVPVTPERAGRFAAALDVALPATYAEVYWTARVTLVSDRSQLDLFERVFRQLFGGVWDPAEQRGEANAPPPAHTSPGPPRPARHDASAAPSSAPSGAPAFPRSSPGDEGREIVLAAMSPDERLRSEDFAALTPQELAELRVLMSRLAVSPPLRRSRRTTRHRHGRLVDLRATLRRAHRSGGDALHPVRRRHRTRRRRVVFLCDISGSMAPYTRAYLQLLVSAVGGARAEAFVFGTRLTRVTRELHATNPDVALARAGRAAPDWAGGTRIGRSVRSFNDDWGRRGLARGAVVVVVSDGWEHDDPASLGREMERLARLAYRIVWVNPRRASARYQPLVGGMAAALPACDRFVSGHSVAALDEVLAAIAEP